MKPIIYVAHPVSGDVKANCDKVLKWLRWLTEVDPSRIYIAPWVGEVLAHLDQDPIPADFYDRVLSDDEEVVQRLDGILLTGVGSGQYRRENGLLKSSGMTRELAACALAGGTILDMSQYEKAEDAAAALGTWGGPTKGAAFIDMYRVRSFDMYRVCP